MDPFDANPQHILTGRLALCSIDGFENACGRPGSTNSSFLLMPLIELAILVRHRFT